MGLKPSELAKIYGKERRTVASWIEKFKESGVFRRKEREIVYKKFGREKRNWLIDLYKKNPVMFLDEARDAFCKRFRMTISASYVSVILHEAGLCWKTLEKRATQIRMDDVYRYFTELNTIPWLNHNLVFLDEVSIDSRSAWRKRGYGMKGEKVVVRGVFQRSSRVSMLCFLGINGILESYMTDGTFSRKTFFEFARDFALKTGTPVRQYPGQYSVWILDGAIIHCDRNLVDYFRTLGIIVIFLPAYSPQLNPIEIVFGLIKRKIQRNHPQGSSTEKNMQLEIFEAVNEFSNKSMQRLFRKCGYKNGKFNPGKGFGDKKNFISTIFK